MKRIIYTLFLFWVLSVPTYAFSGGIQRNSVSPGFVYLTFTIALIALVLSVITIFWILKVKKVQDVALMNYKEDMALTMNGLKGNINRELKNVRREFTKPKPAPKSERPQTKAEPRVVDKKTEDATVAASDQDAAGVKKKPQKRRYYHKKKPGNKPEGGDKN
jgi:hypothetical protein